MAHTHTHTYTLQATTQKTDSKRYNRGTMGQEDCEVCGKRVFLMERLGAENHVFHRSCFRCSSCDVQLKPGSYEFDAQSDKFFCRTHYREVLRAQTIKRTMDQRGISSFEEKDLESSPKKPRRKEKFSSPQPELHSTVSTPKEVKSDMGPISEQLTLPDSDLSRKGSEKMKAGLPSLLKTLAASKQQEREKTTFGVSLSAGNSPTSSPRADRKTKQAPAAKSKTPPPPQPQPPRGTVVLGKPVEHPKAVPEMKSPQKGVSAAKEPQPTAGDSEIPKSTISWLTKGKAVALKSEEPAPDVKVGSRSPEISKRAFTTTAVDKKTSGAPPRPKPPAPRTDSRSWTQTDAKTAPKVEETKPKPLPEPVLKPEKPPLPSVDAKDNETEKSTSLEVSVSVQENEKPPVKPPRRKKTVHGGVPAEVPHVAAVPKTLEPPPTAAMKREESPERPTKEEIPPKRPSVKPKRPAPPRPNQPPSFRVKGSPSKTRPPTTITQCKCALKGCK